MSTRRGIMDLLNLKSLEKNAADYPANYDFIDDFHAMGRILSEYFPELILGYTEDVDHNRTIRIETRDQL